MMPLAEDAIFAVKMLIRCGQGAHIKDMLLPDAAGKRYYQGSRVA